MILDTYFARRFLGCLLLIGSVFLSLIMLVDMIEQIRRFSGEGLGVWPLLALVLLNAPATMEQILPLIVTLATVYLLASLARSSELVVARATGRSGIRALFGPVFIALLVGLLALSMLNPLVAATSNRYNQLTDIYRKGSAAVASLSGEGLWLRQGDSSGQSIIHATGFDAEETILYNVSILAFSAQGDPVRRIIAESAQLAGNTWRLTVVKVWPLQARLNPEAGARYHDTLEIPSSLTEDRIRDSLGRSAGMSIWQLPNKIKELRAAGFSTRRHEVMFQSALANPLFLVAMVLVGAAFTMRHTRFGGTGVAVSMAVLLGFGFYFIRNFAIVLGENGQIPVALAAWAPPAASGLLGMGLLLQVEDG